MEKFRNIDWHPALEDIVDNVFINDERMERESAMYRIMNNNFPNPLENIESEYADINVELIKKYLHEDGEISTDTEDEDNSHKQEQGRPYVPGIKKLPFNFPRRSHLTKAQQAMCLRVLLKLSNNEKKGMNEKERKELEEYMALQEIISKEQKEFLEFAKMKWNDSFNWLIKCNKFVTLKWKAKRQRFEKLPVLYVESLNIPLSVQEINFKIKDIKVTFTSCLRQGTFSKVVLPELDRRYVLNLSPKILLEKYTPLIAPDKETQHFRLPVSEDTYCERLAKETAADFVISSSGLKCLLSNLDPNYSNSWLIPVVVKSYDEKNIIYIDKRLPPTIATIPQKNTWVYKYILKHFFVESSEKTKYTKEDELEKAASLSDSDSSVNDHLKIYEEDLYSCTSDVDESGKSDDLASGKTDFKINNEQNVSYKLFTIGPTESPQHERIRHGVKEYQMLVRTKTDGIEKLSNGESQSLILAPKMEHQLGFGAEAITLEEGLHQWASLKFRPETSLARVRVAADTAEVIQIERHTTMSLSNEIKRLYNVKAEDSLNILHSIIEKLSSLTPGQYIMQHTPQNGPFAYVYKQADSGKNLFDLRTIYQSMIFCTIPKTPWPPIDNTMTTPAIRCFQKMPAMFRPSLINQKFLPGRPRGRPKKNGDVTNNEVPVSPRRSVRLRKTNCS